MNHPFMHLLWKSYRSQREIWLTMLGGMLLLQLLVLSSISQLENPFSVSLFITTLIAPVFLCVSTLLMFVMEEEQGTALWLRLLPIKWWQQLTAGLLCSLALTVVIALLGITVALASAAYFQSGIPSRPFEKVTEIQFLTVLPIWIVGLTASVLIRRIIVVLPLIAAIAVTNVVLTFDLRIHWLPIVANITSICVLPFAVRRWQLGRPWSWPHISRRQVANSTARKDSTTAKSSLRTRFLRRAAMADGMQHRTTLVLYWQELTQAIPFGGVVFTIGASAVVFCNLSGSHFPLWIIWLFIATLEFGLRTFRHDQQKQNGLFWAHRGVSPAKVWLIKNTVWFPLLLAIAFSLTWLESHPAWNLDEVQRKIQIEPVMTFLADPLAAPHAVLTEYINGARTSATHVLIALLSLGYFAAQLCSAWIRPPLVAGAAAFVTFIALPQWTVFCQRQDVPLTFSTWPIVVTCILAILVSSRQWMDRRQSGWIWTKRIAAGCLLLTCVAGAYQYYRISQVSLSYSQYSMLLERLEDSTWESTIPTADLDNPETDQLWLELVDLQADSGKTEAESTTNRKNTVSRTGQILTAITGSENLQQTRLPLQIRTSEQFPTVEILTRKARWEAEALVKQERADLAFDVLLKAERLAEYLAAQSTDWHGFQTCMDSLRALHQQIHWCASSDTVSQEQLTAASLRFEQVKPYNKEAMVMLANREAMFFQLQIPNSKLSQYAASLAHEYSELSRLEVVRHERLRRLGNALAHVTIPSHVDLKDPGLVRWRSQLNRWAETTPTMGLRDDPMLTLWPYGPLTSMFAATHSHHATWWVLQMQIYRREHGQLPTEAKLRKWLTENGHGARMRQLINLETNEPFDLRLQGSGIESAIYTKFRAVYRLDAQQATMGASSFLFSLTENDVESAHAENKDNETIPFNPDRVIFVESIIYQLASPPVSGELAELIRNKK